MPASTATLAIAAVAAAAAAAGWLWSLSPREPFDAQLVPVSGMQVARHEVTIADWRRCYGDGICSHQPRPGFGAASDRFPVTGINWFDVSQFLAWANARSEVPLRLPSLVEWELIAHGLPRLPERNRFDDPRLAWAARYAAAEQPPSVLRMSGGFATTAEGVSDLDGNVWEWTSTCASAAFTGADAARCPAYRVAGEHPAAVSVFIRDPALGGCSSGVPPQHLGLRLMAQ